MVDILKIAISRAWKVDNISTRTIYRWNGRSIGFLKIQSSLRSIVRFSRNMQKC